MPHFEEYYGKNRDKALHMFAVEGDGLSAPELVAFAAEWKLTVPLVTLADSQCPQWDCKTMPNTFVIGVTGMLVYKGSEGWEDAVARELAKRPWPGINKDKLEKECDKASQALAKNDLAKARELAQAVIDAKPGEKAEADAQLILDAIKKRAETLRAAIDAAKESKRYDLALGWLDALAAGFKGADEGNAAAEEAKTLRADKDVKKEVNAWATLFKTLAANKTVKNKSDKVKNIRALQKTLEGTAAAAKAREIATAIEGSTLYK